MPLAQPPQTLNLNHCGIGDTGVDLLAQALRNDHSVRRLWLCGNHVTSKGARSLATMLLRNRSIQTLVLSDNHLCDEGAAELFQVLPQVLQISIPVRTDTECLRGRDVVILGAILGAQRL